MKKLSLLLLFLGLVISSFQPSNASAVVGVIYQNTTTPGPYFTTITPTKSGAAMCKSYFWLVGVGQCGIHDAAKKGGINTITNYDIKKKNILGYQEIETIVYGR